MTNYPPPESRPPWASEDDLRPDPAGVDALTLEVAGAISTTPPFDGWHPFWALPAALAAVRAIGAFVPDDAEVVTAEDYLLASIDHPIDPDAWLDEDTPKPTESDGEFLARLGTDAEKWAEAFVERFSVNVFREGLAIACDRGTLIGWFANAIEAGRDAGRREGE